MTVKTICSVITKKKKKNPYLVIEPSTLHCSDIAVEFQVNRSGVLFHRRFYQALKYQRGASLVNVFLSIEMSKFKMASIIFFFCNSYFQQYSSTKIQGALLIHYRMTLTSGSSVVHGSPCAIGIRSFSSSSTNFCIFFISSSSFKCPLCCSEIKLPKQK